MQAKSVNNFQTIWPKSYVLGVRVKVISILGTAKYKCLIVEFVRCSILVQMYILFHSL